MLGPVHMEAGNPGEVSYPTYPLIKKYLSSHAIPGTWGEVQKCNHAVAKHAHKQSTGTNVCFLRLLWWSCFSINVVVAGTTSVWLRWLAWLSDSTLKLLQYCQFHQRFAGFGGFGGKIVEKNSPRSSNLNTQVSRPGYPSRQLSHGENSPHRSVTPNRVTHLGGVPA